MNYLLDTHIWIWSITEPEKIENKIKEIILKDNLYISPISVWETYILLQRKRIKTELTITDWLSSALSVYNLIEAPLTTEIAVKSREINLHKDPADRFIVATVIINDLTLITSDQKIKQNTEVKILFNQL